MNTPINTEVSTKDLDPALAVVPPMPVAITNPEEEKRVAENIVAIKAQITNIEYKRDEWLKPIKLATDRIKADFDTFLSPLQAALKTANEMFAVYRESPAYQAEVKRREEAASAAREAAEKGDLDTVKAMGESGALAERPNSVATDAGGSVSVRKSWTYEIVDETLVPRGFCKPDPGKLTAAVRAGAREIPGCRVYQKVSTSTRS